MNGTRLRQEMAVNMTRVIAVAACGIALASCSSLSLNMPSFALITAEPEDADLTIDSAPPGAEARASNGGVCRTPCTLSVSGTNDFTVTYTLDGYVPQTVPIRSIQPVRSAMIDLTPPRLDPNPVFAELEPALPPPPPPPNPPPVKRRQRPQTTLPTPPPPSLPFPPFPPLPFPPGLEPR
jgi:hypothetical protein